MFVIAGASRASGASGISWTKGSACEYLRKTGSKKTQETVSFSAGWNDTRMRDLFFSQQGPPGKDGLPGHPGQRGETVSSSNTPRALEPSGVLVSEGGLDFDLTDFYVDSGHFFSVHQH